jgi:hypothetical protein
MLLGVASLRAGKKLYYDGANMSVTNNAPVDNNHAAPTDYLSRKYREGYSL